MILVQKLLFLKNVPVFSSMPPRELNHLGKIAEEMVFQSGQTIITQGEHGETLYLIAQGQVSVVQNGKSVAELSENDFFGEMSILDGEPRSATVVAKSDCLVLSVSKDNLYGILTRHHEVSLHIIRTLTQRLRHANETHSATTG
jgi:CRP-like cAMP-binding protein